MAAPEIPLLRENTGRKNIISHDPGALVWYWFTLADTATALKEG
jgi:hypothetical protein